MNDINNTMALDEPMYNPDNTEEITVENTKEITIETIHNDLGLIISFHIIFSFLILFTIAYRFFKMFF